MLDALDECEEKQRSSLLECVEKIIAHGHSTKIFATSRPHIWKVDKVFTGSPRIQIEAKIPDLENYLARTMDEIAMNKKLQDEIITRLAIDARGM